MREQWWEEGKQEKWELRKRISSSIHFNSLALYGVSLLSFGFSPNLAIMKAPLRCVLDTTSRKSNRIQTKEGLSSSWTDFFVPSFYLTSKVLAFLSPARRRSGNIVVVSAFVEVSYLCTFSPLSA
jgi:hypothetical protein